MLVDFVLRLTRSHSRPRRLAHTEISGKDDKNSAGVQRGSMSAAGERGGQGSGTPVEVADFPNSETFKC